MFQLVGTFTQDDDMGVNPLMQTTPPLQSSGVLLDQKIRRMKYFRSHSLGWWSIWETIEPAICKKGDGVGQLLLELVRSVGAKFSHECMDLIELTGYL